MKPSSFKKSRGRSTAALLVFYFFSGILTIDASAGEQPPAMQKIPESSGGIINLSADTLTYDNQKKILIATGHAEILTEKTLIKADRILLYREEDYFEAEGHVEILDGKNLVYAEKARLRSDGLKGSLTKAYVFVKNQPVSEEVLKTLRDPVCAKKAGTNKLMVEGERIDRSGEKRYRLFDTMFTPCDCGDDPPSWKLKSTRGWVELDQQAYILLPILYVSDVPVMALPAMMFPVGDRRSGLLFPRFAYGRNGFQAQNQLYITLGKSADTTLEAHYIQDRGVKWGAEVRYMPTYSFYGQMAGYFIKDQAVPENMDKRWTASSSNMLILGDRFRLQNNFSLVSDKSYPSDYAFDIWERESEYMKSDISLSKAYDDYFLGVGAVFYQDLKNTTYSLFDANGLSTIQQLPYAQFGLSMKEPFSIPLTLSLDATFINYYDPVNATAPPPIDDPEQLDSIRRSQRLSIYPTIAVPLNLANLVKWNSSLSFRGNFYYSEADNGFSRNTGYGIVRTGFETQASRVYETDGGMYKAIKHDIIPSVEYHKTFVPYASGGSPINIDEIDMIGPVDQILFTVKNSFDYKNLNNEYGHLFDLAISQGFEVGNVENESRLSELGVELVLNWKWLYTRQYIGYEWNAGISEVSSNTILTGSRGDTISVSYNYLTPTGRTHFSQGFEELFASKFDPRLRSAGEINNANFGATFKVIEGLFIGYSTNYSFLADQIMFNTFSMTYKSPCKCWSAGIGINVIPGQTFPDIQFMFDMTNLGNIKG